MYKAFFLSLVLLLAARFPALAQPAPPAMPVAAVQAESLADPSRPVVLELFTARSCAFCPRADKMLAELSGRQGVIAIACHVDYFRGADPLAQPFCIARQAWYMDRLRAGPAYTPQLVINGMRDTAVRNTDRLDRLIAAAIDQNLDLIRIRPLEDKAFELQLPDSMAKQDLKGWMFVVAAFRKPVQGPAESGGEALTYVHAADTLRLMPLDALKGTAFKLTIPLSNDQEGFAVLLQRQDTGQIAAAGQYLKR